LYNRKITRWPMNENVVFNVKKNAVTESFFKSLKAEWVYNIIKGLKLNYQYFNV